MKKHLVLLLLAGSLPFSAFAQLSPERCNQRCMDSDMPLREGNLAKYGKQLDRIRAQKKTETDPARLKALEEQEEDVLEQGREAQQNFCNYVCAPKSE